MKLISWNVNGRRDIVGNQVEALAARSPDIVALQEVRAVTVERWADALRDVGLTSFLTTHDFVGERKNFVAVASRFDLSQSPTEIEVPLPELVLPVQVKVRGVRTELICTHVPNAQGWKRKKIEHLEALYHYLALAASKPSILCGDFNCPRREFSDGTVFTWAQTEDGRLRRNRGEHWDTAERRIICGLGKFGFVDVFRYCNDFKEEGSWTPARPGSPVRRFDHIFADRDLRPRSCRFIHGWRTERPRLSDHSAIEALFEPVP